MQEMRGLGIPMDAGARIDKSSSFSFGPWSTGLNCMLRACERHADVPWFKNFRINDGSQVTPYG